MVYEPADRETVRSWLFRVMKISSPVVQQQKVWGMPAEPKATDAEIAATAARWGLNGGASRPAHRKSAASHVQQRLGHGRSNAVTVEVKHSGRITNAHRPP